MQASEKTIVLNINSAEQDQIAGLPSIDLVASFF
jgi:DNA uptake protein ComE-like DNA-binding protein